MEEKNQELLKKAMDIRGAFINDIILLEKIIDSWISKFFCANKKREKAFFELILCHDRFSVEAKRQVFLYIVQNYSKEFFIESPTVSKDLAFIIEKRNILAHWLLDTSPAGLESGKLNFVKFKNSSESLEFTDESIASLRGLINKYTSAIAKLAIPPLD